MVLDAHRRGKLRERLPDQFGQGELAFPDKLAAEHDRAHSHALRARILMDPLERQACAESHAELNQIQRVDVQVAIVIEDIVEVGIAVT